MQITSAGRATTAPELDALDQNGPLEEIFVPDVIIGSKSWCPDRIGNFLLCKGPGVFRGFAITQAGGCAISVFDGLSFNHRRMHKIFRAVPAVLGQFMLDAGFNDGLILEIRAHHPSLSLQCTITWNPQKVRQPTLVAVK